MASLRNVYVSCVFIATGGLLFGYVIGITSDVITGGQLLCPGGWTGAAGSWGSWGYTQCYKLGAWENGLLSSLNLIGALFSSLVCFWFADILGRKLEVQIGAALYFIGAAIAGVSPTLWGIYLGFTVYGLGIGFAMHAAPVYIAEIAPASVRGTLVSAKEAVVVLGIFLGFFIGFMCSGIDTIGWRFMVLVSGVFAFIMGLGISFIPQSPRFLVLSAIQRGGLLGPEEDLMLRAQESLCFFRMSGPDQIIDELRSMHADIAASVGYNGNVGKWTAAFSYPRPLVIGCGLVILQQVTGQPSVLYFSTNIFKAAGFHLTAALSSVGVGVVKLLATLFTVWCVDGYGRRLLLFVGISFMVVALVVLGMAFSLRECAHPGVSLQDCAADDVQLPEGWAWSSVIALMVYVSGYQVGFGPIAWLMISEVFPVSVRGAALAVAAVTNFGFNILVNLTQEVLEQLLTPAGVFFLYMVLSLASLAFVKRIVPETKGETLEQIEKMLAGSHDARDVLARS